MNHSPCPDPEELRRYTRGLLAEDGVKELEKHLQECPACEKTLDTITEVTDTIPEGLRSPSADDQDFSNPDLQTAVEKGKAIEPGEPEATQIEEPLPVERLGQYRLVEKLGQGGMGAVYRAVHIRLEKPVAIKILIKTEGRRGDFVARFEQEMRAIGRLSHPNLVQAFDAGETEDKRYLFLVMELVEGQDFGQLVEQHGPLPIAEACDVIRQAAQGLEYVHQQGRVHRDVKPSNLMLSDAGQVKILDLGLALLSQREVGEMTRSGLALGTPQYMAPEQAIDSHLVDPRADVYSLGCTFYNLLTGRPPYLGRTDLEVAISHRQLPIPPLRKARPDVPAALDAVFRKMMAKRPEDRPASMGEVIAALDACVALQSDSPAKPQTGKRRPTFGKKVATAALGLSLAALMVLAAVLIRVRHSDNTETTLQVPDGAHVTVGRDGNVTVDTQGTGNRGAEAQRHKGTEEGTGDREQGTAKSSPIPNPQSLIPSFAVAPFDAKKAREHQEAWARHLGVPVEIRNSIGMKFVLIPPGEFDMGSTPEDQAKVIEGLKAIKSFSPTEEKEWLDRISAEGPRHRVKITRPFYLGIYPVTQAEYERVMDINPSVYAGKPLDASAFSPALRDDEKRYRQTVSENLAGKDTRDYPVDTVSWHDCVAFCARLSAMPEERRAEAAYRLPTEAQWEYACRAGTTTLWYNGDDPSRFTEIPGSYRNTPNRVEQNLPNAWSLYDLCGRTEQWCADFYLKDYYARSPVADPLGPERGSRVTRGGQPRVDPFRARSASRHNVQSIDRLPSFGFRLLREIPVGTGNREQGTGNPSPIPNPFLPVHFFSGHNELINSTVRSTSTWPPSGPTRLLCTTAL